MNNLKQKLKEIKNKDYDFTDVDLKDLCYQMLESIGTIDSELRDGLIYNTFGQIIVIQELLKPKQLSQLLSSCLHHQKLFYGIGDKETDAVFTRSFSVLLVALILHADHRNSFLSESEVIFVKEELFNYFEKEKDFRGFVSDKGWAHSIAHGADALGELAKNDFLREKELLELLTLIKSKVLYADAVYQYNEEERMVVAVLQVFEREVLSEEQLVSWIGSFPSSLEDEKKIISDPHSLNIMLNVRNFLSSLYFRLKFRGIENMLQAEIVKALDVIREY